MTTGENGPEVTCGGCVGACCRKGTPMELTKYEAADLIEAGTKLKMLHRPVYSTQTVKIVRRLAEVVMVNGQPHAIEQTSPVTLTARHGLYELQGDCAYLQEGVDVGPVCTNYDNRPGICRDFEAGGEGCLDIRAARATQPRFAQWQPVEITAKPTN